MMGIPLYLHDPSIQKLDFDGVKRLSIDLENRSVRKIPLRYVSRVVCHERVEITNNALLVCLKKGIPISIISKSGAIIGWCMGVLRKENTLQNLLIHALDDLTWQQIYQDWFDNQKLSITAHVFLLCGVQCSAGARANPRVHLCNAHRLKHGKSCGKILTAITQLAYQELAARLHEQINDPKLLVAARTGLNLIADLNQLLSLYAHIDIHHIGHLPTAKELTRWSVTNFQKNANQWDERINGLIFRFEQFLRQHWL